MLDKRPSKSEAIKNFLIASTHPDLAELYSLEMECQVNVAQDGGERIEGEFKGRAWAAWTDGIQQWKPFRIPYNAGSEPEYTDGPMAYDLAAHAEGIGMTGWNWMARQSEWVAFDFDAITGHSEKHPTKLTPEQLEAVRQAAWNIEWVTVRRSTSGKGLHLYVFLDGVATNNHNEHAALARAILAKMSALAGFDFSSKIDACGGNMWVWHRKMKVQGQDSQGLILIKQGTTLKDVPANWKEHIRVVTNKRAKVAIPTDVPDDFEELVGQHTHTPLDDEHKRLFAHLDEIKASWWWDQDHHMCVTHTIHLKEAHEALSLKGLFKTVATGKERGIDHNCFMFPLRKGAWAVRRYTPGVQEDASWEQDKAGWTRCYYNRDPDLATASKAYGAVEDTSGHFVFREAELAQRAAKALGVHFEVPIFMSNRPTRLKAHKDGRLVVEVDSSEHDQPEKMQGWLKPKKKDFWLKILNANLITAQEPEIGNFDDIVRHLVTEAYQDYGWVLKGDGVWKIEPITHISIALESTGLSSKEVKAILGSSVMKCWQMVNKPFQPEYPGDRQWNRDAAQYRFPPSLNEQRSFPHWSSLLNHCGKGLDEAIKKNGWARANGIATGGDYLKVWVASLFQCPLEPLPYLFLWSKEQNTGKSSFHEALSLLLTKGYQNASSALTSQGNFNGELKDAIVCVVEETDLNKDRTAYNRIKEWVTSRMLPLHEKRETPCMVPNYTHWIHCFAGETWIFTSMGPRRIRDLDWKDYNVYIDGYSYKASAAFERGYKDLYTLETKEGHSLTCTKDHKVLVDYAGLRFWKEAQELQLDDEIVLNQHHNISWDGDGTFEGGYLLGYLYGDGTLTNCHIEVEKNSDDVCLIPTMVQYCGAQYTLNELKTRYEIHSPYLRFLCEQVGLVDKKEMTHHMESMSSDWMVGFIRGLFDADGCVYRSKTGNIGIKLTQSDRLVLQTMQRWLLYFGINSSIYGEELTLTKRNVDLFLARIGFGNPNKQKNGLKYLEQRIKTYGETYTARFKSLTFCRHDMTYDLTVPVMHCMSANGIMAHNCTNDHKYCPILPGDTRITMIQVPPLDPMEMIPKKDLMPKLEAEAPDFMAELLALEIPPSNDRLNVPVIETEEKIVTQRANRTQLETFLEEKTYHVQGKWILWGELHDKFLEWLDPNEVHYWSKVKTGRELPLHYPKGRNPKDGQFYIGNISFEPYKPGETILPRLVLDGDKLVPEQVTVANAT